MKIKGIIYLTILAFILSAGMASAKSVSFGPRDRYTYKATGSVKVIPVDIIGKNVNDMSKMTTPVKSLKNHISLEVDNSFSQTSPNFIFSNYAFLPGENVKRTDIWFTSRLKI